MIIRFSLSDLRYTPLPREHAVVDEEAFICSKEGGGAFEACADLVVTLIGGDDSVDGHSDDGFVAVTETEAERSDPPVGVRAGDHLYGCIEPKI